ncbi:MAG: hypothetical protein ABSC42_01405 [Tepidisphaeraceae bacterium]
MTQPAAQPIRPAKRLPADLKVWAIVLPLGWVLLLGRYNWSHDGDDYALEGWLASGWMLLLTLPALFYTSRILWGRRWAIGLAGLFALLCTLPYRWLGLASSRFWSDHFSFSNWLTDAHAPVPNIAWFPAAIRQEPVIPHEAKVFALLVALPLAALLCASRLRPTYRWFADHLGWGVGAMALTLIVAQSWLHLSLRAPYAYLMHYAEPKPVEKAWVIYNSGGPPIVHTEQEIQPNGWWHLYLFPHYRGAVNLDYGNFHACEEVFQGVAPNQPSTIARRLLTFYLSSQWVCFFNPYYVFLFLNTVFWLAAVLAGFGLARRLTDVPTATVLALFIATGCGFIFFVNQPTSYLSGYAAEMVVIYLFERLIVADKNPGNAWLFALLYGLGMLVTDLMPLLVFFPIYAVARLAPLKRTLLSLALACCCYAGTLAFLAYVARVPNVAGNFDILATPFAELKDCTPDKFYILCLEFLNRFAMDLFHGFLILPLLPAIFGLAFLRERQRILSIVALLLPAVCTVGLLEFSGARFRDWPLAALPRLAYIAYPAVYLLAAIGLVEGSRTIFRNWPRVARLAPYLFLIAVFVLNNLDVFGVPATYYHFYFGLNSSGFMPFGEPHP